MQGGSRFRVGYSRRENAGVRDGDRIYPPVIGVVPNDTHDKVKRVVHSVIKGIEGFDDNIQKLFMDRLHVYVVDITHDVRMQSRACYRFELPETQPVTTPRFQFTNGRFDQHDTGIRVQLRIFLKEKMAMINHKLATKADETAERAMRCAQSAHSLATRAMDGLGEGLSVVHEKLAGQKRQLNILEDKVREGAATAVREALRTRGVESRLGAALDARVNAIVERALLQRQPDAHPVAPPEESLCYVCFEELSSGEAVVALCGKRHPGHTIHLDCAVGMLAVERADTGDGFHAFGQQVCGLCRARAPHLQRLVDEGGYPYSPEPPAIQPPAQQAVQPIAGPAPLPVVQLPEQPVMPAAIQRPATSRDLQRLVDEGGYPYLPEPPAIQPPAQQAVQPIAGPAPLPVVHLPEQPVMPVAVQPPVDEPDALDQSDTAPFVAMGFQDRQLVRDALQKVGTEGTCAVVQYLLDYARD